MKITLMDSNDDYSEILNGTIIDYCILPINSHDLYGRRPWIIASGYTTNAVINAAHR